MAPKKKQEKMALGDFLTNQSLGSWADEMDAQPIPSATPGFGSRDGGERRAFTQPSWGEARADRGAFGGGSAMGGRGPSYDRPRFDREPVAFPTQPPYTAHLGNLDYNVTSVDVEDFLAGCDVTSVRIVEDKQEHKPKGFGYVEFKTPEGLRKALDKSESQFMGRNVKISVADPPKDRPESSRDFSDWTRRGPLPDLPQPTRQPSSRGFSRNMDNMSDAGSERGGTAGGRKPGFFAEDGKSRDFSNWERKGPLSPLPQPGPPNRDGGRVRDGAPARDRKQSPSWGEGRSDAGSRPPRREFEPRPPVERTPTAAEADTQWRAKMRPDPTPEATPAPSTPASPAAVEAPKERPRLNLAKRTVSTVDSPDAATAAATTPSDSKASPFGAARPIDTAAREREVAEKREIAIRQKKEADDKAKEEKTARDAAAKAARTEQDGAEKIPTGPSSERPERGAPRRPSRQPSSQQQNQNGTRPGPQAKENGDASTQARPSFSILARDADEAEGADAAAAKTNGAATTDKDTLPQEPTADGTDAAAAAADPTVKALEDDGWSTVPASGKTKGNRRAANAGGRAVAS